MEQTYHQRLGDCSAKFWCVRSLIAVLHSSILHSEQQGSSAEGHSVLVELLLDQLGEGLDQLEAIEQELFHELNSVPESA